MYKQLLTALLLLFMHRSFAQVVERTYHFKDTIRNRPLVTEVWYPGRDGQLPSGKLPLILMSHGTGGGRLTLSWLAEALAQHGFMVAAVDHWGNTYDNKIPIEFVKPWERPLDVSFILTALLADPEFGSLIDRERIGAIGFSYGGYTVLALAGATVDYPTMLHYYKTVGHKEIEVPEMPGLAHYLDDPRVTEPIKHLPVLKDRRINAFFAISPALGPGFVNSSQVATIDRPVYIVGSQSDSMAPVRTNAANYHHLIAGSGYFEFPGKTGHYVMLPEANEEMKKAWPTGFVDDPSVDRHAVHLKVDDLAVAFFIKVFSER